VNLDFIQRGQALIDEITNATTPEAKQDAKDRLAALIKANNKGRTWTADNRLKQTGERE
jgi:anti-sigma factor ChrR (cupin superfamily)